MVKKERKEKNKEKITRKLRISQGVQLVAHAVKFLVDMSIKAA